MPTYEGLRLKILKYNRKIFGSIHQRKLKNKSFTIISNNCWGGEVYEYYNLVKQSPTVGLFFMADDYIKFLTNLKGYLSAELTFINPDESRWRNNDIISSDKRWGMYPVGKIEARNSDGKSEDVEIFFLHYKDEQEAKQKWKRRVDRINWNHLLVKFNDQNGCNEDHISKFDGLQFTNKVFFSVKKHSECKSAIQIKAPKDHEYVRASYEPFGTNKYCDVDRLINSL